MSEHLTEQKLWSKLRACVRPEDVATRIETATHDGVSDVHYFIFPWHGWIETKVCNAKKMSSKLAFNSDFTTDQLLWLRKHHCPQVFLRSWLLIETVEWYLLLTPDAAGYLHTYPQATIADVWDRAGVYKACVVHEAYEILRMKPERV